MSAAMKVLVNAIIVVEHILKFIEMVFDFENHFKISEFYPSLIFVKVEKIRGSFENLKHNEYFLQNFRKFQKTSLSQKFRI